MSVYQDPESDRTMSAMTPGAPDNDTWMREKSNGLIVEDAPLELIDRLRSSFIARSALPTPTPSPRVGLVQRMLAALSFDSWGGLTPAGVRSVEVSPSRHLTFETERADIALSLYSTDASRARWNLVGQALMSEPSPFVVEVTVDGGPALVLTPTEAAEFTASGLQGAELFIVLVAEQFEVTVGPVALAPNDS